MGGELLYIGMTRWPNVRKYAHFKRWPGSTFRIVLTDEEWKIARMERGLVHYYTVKGTPLKNVMPGGLYMPRPPKYFSPQTRLKMRLAKLGKKMSTEQRQKRIEYCKERMKDPAFAAFMKTLHTFAGPASNETRKAISAGLRGKSPSKETRAKMRAAKLGKPRSEETKKKIGVSSSARMSARWKTKEWRDYMTAYNRSRSNLLLRIGEHN